MKFLERGPKFSTGEQVNIYFQWHISLQHLSGLWDWFPGEVITPRVKPRNFKEKILYSRLLQGPQVEVKLESSKGPMQVSERLLRKKVIYPKGGG